MGWFEFIAGVASIVGCALSFAAMKAAASAARAAKEAREAIIVRTTADELELACARAQRLLDHLIQRRYAEATLLADDLVATLSEVSRRRRELLDATTRDKLLLVNAQLTVITGILTKHQPPALDMNDQNSVITSARSYVVKHLREALGDLKARIDLHSEVRKS